MKATGIIRRMDDLGRIVIPKEIRRGLGIKDGDPLIITVKDDTIIYEKIEETDVLFQANKMWIRRIDDLGRIIVSPRVRTENNIKEGDPFEFFTDNDKIILKKYPVMNEEKKEEIDAILIQEKKEEPKMVCIEDLKVNKGYQVIHKEWFDGRYEQSANVYYIGREKDELIFTNPAILIGFQKYGTNRDSFRVKIDKIYYIIENPEMDKE